MIVSHAHKFIFIKSRKTGGTSVEIGLSKYAGPEDIITPITPRDELVRIEFGNPCQNFSSSRCGEVEYVESLRNGEVDYLPGWVKKSQVYFNHMTYSQIKELLPSELETYHTVSIERHPFEKAVSLANFLIGYKRYVSGSVLEATTDQIREKISGLIENGLMRDKIRNWDVYTDKGIMRVGTMLRFDQLQADFEAFCKKVGLEGQAQILPKTKVGQRDKKLPAHEVLTASQRAAIKEICAEEFDYFGYET